MKIYIAGPMRGIPDWNFPAFDAAVERWTREGYQAFSPAITGRALGYKSTNMQLSQEDLKHVMIVDISCIYRADGLALLPGWEHSRGVAVELALAQFLRMQIYDAETFHRIEEVEHHAPILQRCQ